MVPAYLKPIARELKVKGGKTTMALVCDCGSELFWIYENKLTSEEKKQMESYENALRKLSARVKVSGAGQVYIGKDLNNVLIHAEDEAKQMGDEYVSVEHLFMAMMKHPEWVRV